MPGCGVNVCATPATCVARRGDQCKLPVGPTVNSGADMMASAVLARTATGLFPRIQIGKRGIKITRPGYYNVARGDSLGAWTKGNLCCT